LPDQPRICVSHAPSLSENRQPIKGILPTRAMKCSATPLLSGMLAGCVSLAACKHPVVPLTREICIWQHAWSPAVREAAATAMPDTGGFTPLAARISWHGNTPAVAWPDVPWQNLAAEHKRLCATIRAEPLPSAAAALPASRDIIVTTAREVLRRAAASGVTLDEIQLDFDAAESQLAIYATWLRCLRGAVFPVRVTFTAYPALALPPHRSRPRLARRQTPARRQRGTRRCPQLGWQVALPHGVWRRNFTKVP